MRGNTRNLILKYAGTLGIFSFLYPVILILRVLLFKDKCGAEDALFHAALIFGGHVITGIIVKGRESLKYYIASYALLVVPLVSAWFIYRDLGIWRLLLELVLAFSMYFIGIRQSLTPFRNIFQRSVIVAGALFLTFSLIAAFYYNQFKFLLGTISTCTYVFIFISLILKTQQNLDSVFIQRHIESSSVPKNIRKFNSGLAILLFAVVAVIVNIKGTLSTMALWMKNMLIGAVWLLIKVLTFIFGSSEDSAGPRQQEDIKPNLPFSEGENQGSLVTNIVMGVIMAAAVIFLIYALYPRIPYIAAAIMEKLRALLEAIRNFVRNLLKLPPPEPELSEDYQDETEKLERYRQKKKEAKKSIRTLKKALRKITDPVEKVRNLYCMVLFALRAKGIDISRADTTGEICEKSMSVKGLEDHMIKLTNVYDRVRYGERTPPAHEVELAEQAYSQVDKALRS